MQKLNGNFRYSLAVLVFSATPVGFNEQSHQYVLAVSAGYDRYQCNGISVGQ